MVSSIGQLDQDGKIIKMNIGSTLATQMLTSGGIPKVTAETLKNYANIVEDINQKEDAFIAKFADNAINDVEKRRDLLTGYLQNVLSSDPSLQRNLSI